MGEFTNRLRGMEEVWKKNKKEGIEKFPAGVFSFRLQSAKLQESQNTGKLMVHREHLCLSGESAGRVLHDFMQLENEVGLQFAQRWIDQMGFQIPDKPEQFEDIVAEISAAAPCYKAKVVHSGDFVNLRIMKVYAPDEIPEDDVLSTGEASFQNQGAAQAQEAEQSADGGAPAAEGVSLEQLNDFCDAFGIPVPTAQKQDFDAILGILSSYDWVQQEGSLEAGDKELLTALGLLGADAPAEGEGAEEGGEDAALLEALLKFAEVQGVEGLSEQSSLDDVINSICSSGWDKGALTPDEVSLLEGIGATFVEPEKPKTAPAPARKAPPAAQAAPAPARRAAQKAPPASASKKTQQQKPAARQAAKATARKGAAPRRK